MSKIINHLLTILIMVVLVDLFCFHPLLLLLIFGGILLVALLGTFYAVIYAVLEGFFL